nr:hypothetical protein GCM10020093_113600 [Planobispora longispora]
MAAVVACGFEPVEVEVTGPVGDPVRAVYAWRDAGPGTSPSGAGAVDVPTAVIELAEASGLRRLPASAQASASSASSASSEAGPAAHGGVELAPLTATSRGTGELIAHAVRRGARRVVLGLGGSASTDGGAGMMSALGVRFLDAQGDELPPGGAALRALDEIDTSGLPDIGDVEFVVASDVDNPCSARTAPPPSTARRRAPPPRT